MIIAQITDCHIGQPGTRTADGYDPAAGLRGAVAALNALDPQPDLVIATGDLTDKSTPDEYAHLAELLSPLKAPLYAIPGNHDAKEPFVEALSPRAMTGPAGPFVHWAGMIEDEHGPLRLVLIDTHEPLTVGGTLCAERLTWLRQVLGEEHGIPVFLAMHHPPFYSGIPVFDGFGFEGLEAFRSLIAARTDLDRIICGHFHRAMTAQLGRCPVFVAPSTAYTYPLELKPSAPYARVPEPTGFALHIRMGPRDWISHTLPLPVQKQGAGEP